MTKVINKKYTKKDLDKLNALSSDRAKSLGKWVKDHGEYRSANLTTGSDGGALIPQGVLNAAIDLSNRKFQLKQYVNNVNVANGMGTMPVLDPNETAKSKDELEKDPDLDNDLGSIKYNVKTFLGRLNISNEFIEDSNANVMPLLTRQLGTVINNTENAEIAKAMEATPAKSISTMDDLITAIANVDPRFQSNIFMDPKSFAKVREFKDANGRYLLNTNDNTIMGIPVVVVPAYTGLTGIYVGDLTAAIVLFNRKETTLQYNRPGIYGTSLVAALRMDVEPNPKANALVHLSFDGNDATK